MHTYQWNVSLGLLSIIISDKMMKSKLVSEVSWNCWNQEIKNQDFSLRGPADQWWKRNWMSILNGKLYSEITSWQWIKTNLDLWLLKSANVQAGSPFPCIYLCLWSSERTLSQWTSPHTLWPQRSFHPLMSSPLCTSLLWRQELRGTHPLAQLWCKTKELYNLKVEIACTLLADSFHCLILTFTARPVSFIHWAADLGGS